MASNTNYAISIIHKHYNNKEFFPDLFDIIDYNDENDMNMNEQEIWEKIKEEFNLDYKFDNTLDNLQEEQSFHNPIDSDHDSKDEIIEEEEEEEEEEVLSQRLSQLSTTSDYEHEPSVDGKRRRRLSLTTTSELITKKFRTTSHDITTNNSIPEYLLSKNKLFDRMINKTIPNISSIVMDQLRQMAFFMHKIYGCTILHELWSTYLRAGTGHYDGIKIDDNDENISIQVDRQYWCHHVKSLIRSRQQSFQIDMTEEDLVYQHLREFNEKLTYYENKFQEMKSQLICWTSTLEETIQKFIFQYSIASLRMKCDSKLALLAYEYRNEILQRQYLQETSTDYQKRIGQRLYNLEVQLETAKYELLEYRQRVICNKPPASFDSLEISFPSLIHTMKNQQLFNRYQNLIRQTKTDLMAINLQAKQAMIYQYQTLFDEETNKMKENKEIPPILTTLINKRSINMHNKMKELSDFTINYHIKSSYDQLENTMERIGFLPNLIIDSNVNSSLVHLTNQQLKLLNRGPTYVTLGQIHISSSFQTLEDMMSKQYASLRHQMAIIFEKYYIDISRSTTFQQQTYRDFQKIYSIPLPDDIQQRAIYENKLVQTIRQFLQKNNLILRRTADENNLFYLGNMTDFTNISNEYMKNNIDNYKILINMDETTKENVQQQLKKKFLMINSELEKLFHQKRFDVEIHQKLRIKIDNLKLPYLYFLPDVSLNNSLQVKPMVSAHGSATTKIGQFLKQILRPLVINYMSRTTFHDESQFMEKLHYYHHTEHHLHPTTLFVTMKITNSQTMISHKSMCTILVDFLNDHLATNKVFYTALKTLNQTRSISIDTIRKLTELYLENNVFYYDRKIYEFIRGAPNSLPLSEILFDIYLFAYEKVIFDDRRLHTELYGRYKDQIFFTWNSSKDELLTFLQTITERRRGIQMETSIGRCVHFLNIQIENRQGYLHTSVYHDHSQMWKYTLPYVVGHAKFKHALWFRTALIRAVRCCSNFSDFNQEQIYLEMTCLANGYSSDFVETQLKHFYIRFNAEKIHFCLDQTVYERLRRRIFDFIKQQRTLSDKQQALEDKGYIFYFTYPYDYGSYYQFNKKFQSNWKEYLKDDPQLLHMNTKYILNPQHIYSLNTLLAEEKPSLELLQIFKKIID